jgi:hypothetical protein
MIAGVADAMASASMRFWLRAQLLVGPGVWKQFRPLSRMLDNAYEWWYAARPSVWRNAM